ncbi:MAG: hypothetical protein HXX13_18425 [Bacteroidetes bacterium]|nr:hypothetical protein [Bacteroidota bacterium]
MESYILSKSTYIRGLQCLKSLYLNKHRPYLRDKLSEEQLAKFARGHSVGKLAQDLFPGGIEIPRPSASSALKTEKLINEGFPVIYEACFIHNEVIIAIDILVKQEEGWNAYEVKSSGALSETYFNDAYLQNFVICGSGLPLKEFYLIHRDTEIEIAEGVDPDKLFIFTKLPDAGKEQEESIRGRLLAMKESLLLNKSPDIKPGKQCMYPYPCDFRGICWKGLDEAERNGLLYGGDKM